jgi:UDP-glucose 4-epimerase
MRVVVTGGAGFIGSAVTRALVAAGCHVVVVDDLSTGRADALPRRSRPVTGRTARQTAGRTTGPSTGPSTGRVELVEASVLDAAALRGACRGATSIVHLAAQVSVAASVTDPRPTYDLNVTGTLEVLEAARREHAQVVFASSAAVYGPVADGVPITEATPPTPVSPYALSKLAGEELLATWQRCYALPTLALRFFNVYGPGQRTTGGYAAVVPALVTQALAGGPLHVDGDGLQTRDFVPVATIARVVTRAVRERTSSTAPVNVATGNRTSLLDLVATLEQVLGRSLTVEHGPARAGDVRDSCGDPAALRRLFPGLRTGSVEAGLRATVRWNTTGGAPTGPSRVQRVPQPRSGGTLTPRPGLGRSGDHPAEGVHPALPRVDT